MIKFAFDDVCIFVIMQFFVYKFVSAVFIIDSSCTVIV